MEPATARWLVSGDAQTALAAAAAESDPSSLAAATRLRALVAPERAAAVLGQIALRRRAVAKFGPLAGRLFLTPDGLEQATRGAVAARRAHRFAAAGVASVADLGCGVGADALALQQAGLTVLGVERDEVTAVFAEANLGVPVEVGDVTEVWPRWAASDPALGVFADPARRTGAGRSWRMEDLSPPWDFVLGLLDGSRPAAVKVGPGIPHAVIPDGVEAEWVSESGTVVECALWAGPGSHPGRRRAVVDGVELVAAGGARGAAGGARGAAAGARGSVDGGAGAGDAGLEEFLYEPDGAVVRAGLVDEVARLVRGRRVSDGIAYLTAPWHMPTPFASAFVVREVLPFDEKVLRGWVRERGVGTLEIKKRGIDVDPADLRRRLKPRGNAAATLVLTPTPAGARVIVCERV